MNPESLFPEAVYREQEVPHYRGNRWIEALPPIIDEDEATDKMQRLVLADDAARAASTQIRLHMIAGIKNCFLQPLDQHLALFSEISVLLRDGYVPRSPERPEFLRTLLEGVSKFALPAGMSPPRQRLGPGSGPALIGMSGVGKTTAVEAVLQCYPQVIWHPRLHGSLKCVHQIVWMKLSCSHDGSTGELCKKFFELVDFLLGTAYTRLYCKGGATVNDLRSGMARVAFLHGLGLLVVDEIQNLNVAKSGGADLMMNFFKLLRDEMKVPMLLIGTDAAVNVVGGDPQLGRRHDGIPRFEPMKNDKSFTLFLESLFEAQYLRRPIAVTQPVVDLLYYLSQGISDVVVQLFIRAQARALACGIEQLSAELFNEVYRDSFGLLHVFLEMMRRGIKIPHGRWDRAVLEAKLTAADPLAISKSSVGSVPEISRGTSVRVKAGPVNRASTGEDDVIGVPKKRFRRTKGAESKCLLVRAVQQGKAKQISPHQALSDAGFIFSLGAQALAA